VRLLAFLHPKKNRRAGRDVDADAYSTFAGARHPQLLGSKVLEGWPERADFNAHV
jgi:hypothetical protein